MLKGLVILFLFLVLAPAAAFAVEAEPAHVFAPDIVIPEGPVKAGDAIGVSVNFKNISSEKASVEYAAPYVLFPIIREADTGKVMEVYTPPVDTEALPKTVEVAPGAEFTIATNKINIVKDVAGSGLKSKLAAVNESIAALPPGNYVVTYQLWLGKVNGAPSPPMPASSKAFVITE